MIQSLADVLVLVAFVAAWVGSLVITWFNSADREERSNFAAEVKETMRNFEKRWFAYGIVLGMLVTFVGLALTPTYRAEQRYIECLDAAHTPISAKLCHQQFKPEE